jgi:hypothetical protein
MKSLAIEISPTRKPQGDNDFDKEKAKERDTTKEDLRELFLNYANYSFETGVAFLKFSSLLRLVKDA